MLKVLHHSDFALDLPSYGIEVPIRDLKAQQVARSLQQFAPQCLLHLGPTDCPLISYEHLLLAHERDYVLAQASAESLIKTLETSFELKDQKGQAQRYNPDKAKRPLSELAITIRHQVAASLKGMELALAHGRSYFLGGGMHHAMSFGGRGFCHFHDGIIGLRSLQQERKIKRAWIIDLDAHKGDGTAELTCDDSTLLSLSIHMEKGWPLDGPMYNCEGQFLPWFLPSDVDIPIAQGREDQYLERLEDGLKTLAQAGPRPDIAWVIDGADAYEKDSLPSAALLNLSRGQMLERSLLVDSFLEKHSIPVAYVMGGGYGDEVAQVHSDFIHALAQK